VWPNAKDSDINSNAMRYVDNNEPNFATLQLIHRRPNEVRCQYE